MGGRRVRYGWMGGRRVRGEYRFSSLMKQKKKGENFGRHSLRRIFF